MPTLADIQKTAQREIANGANATDVANWVKAWQADPEGVTQRAQDWSATPEARFGSSPASLLLGTRPSSATSNAGYISNPWDVADPGRNEDGSIDQDALDRAYLAKKQHDAYTVNGVYTPPTSVFGDLTRFSKNGTGNVLDAYSPVNSGRGAGGAELIDPSQIIHDPNYGDFTARSNLKQTPGDSTSGFMGQLGKYAPAAISTIMSAGMGAAAGPLIGSLLSATMAPGGVANKLAMGQPVDWGKTALNAGVGAAGGLLGGAGGMVPPEVSSAFRQISPYVNLGRGIYGASKGSIGSGIGAGLTLADILKNAGGQ